MIMQGIDSNGVDRVLLLDANGKAIISASQLTTTGGKIAVDVNGKIIISPVVPSAEYPTPKIGRTAFASLPAGESYNIAKTIPNNEYWKLTMLSVIYVGTAAGVVIYPYINIGSNYVFIARHTSLVTNNPYPVALSILLGPSWVIGVYVNGATLNDDLYIDYTAEHIYTL